MRPAKYGVLKLTEDELELLSIAMSELYVKVKKGQLLKAGKISKLATKILLAKNSIISRNKIQADLRYKKARLPRIKTYVSPYMK